MRKPACWNDREDYIFKIEKVTSTLRIIADACGNGGYTGTENVEEALNLLADNTADATKQLRLALWPNEQEPRSKAYLEYRQRFDAFWAAIDSNSDVKVDADDALRDAVEALRTRPVSSWCDVAELGVLAHDHAWNRYAGRYIPRDCPDDILTALILGVLQMQPGDARLHEPPPGWKPSVTGSITISN